MRTSLVVAVADNGVIGNAGRLPWRMPSDLETFRRLTMGKPVIMGRKTFQSLKKPLDGRDNIVVSRDPSFRAGGATLAASLEAALAIGRSLAAKRGVDEVMVIGGAEIYRAALPLADRIYLTRVHGAPEGDTNFPDLDREKWREALREQLARAAGDDYAATLVVLDRA